MRYWGWCGVDYGLVRFWDVGLLGGEVGIYWSWRLFGLYMFVLANLYCRIL